MRVNPQNSSTVHIVDSTSKTVCPWRICALRHNEGANTELLTWRSLEWRPWSPLPRGCDQTVTAGKQNRRVTTLARQPKILTLLRLGWPSIGATKHITTIHLGSSPHIHIWAPLPTAHLCQLLFDRLNIFLKQIGPHQTHSTVDVKTNTTCKPKSCSLHWYNGFILHNDIIIGSNILHGPHFDYVSYQNTTNIPYTYSR